MKLKKFIFFNEKFFFLSFLYFFSFIKTDCPPIYPPQNGQLVNQFNKICSFKENSICRLVCKKSHKLVGSFERVCLNGQWTGNDAFCIDTSIKCPPLTTFPKNGYIQGLCQSYSGSVCKFGCLNGYTLNNTEPLICLSNGEWSFKLPSCENEFTDSCDINKLKSFFKNGIISCTKDDNLTYNIACKFSCLQGYQLLGDPVINCQSNGKWNNLSPTCVLNNIQKSLISSNTNLEDKNYPSLIKPYSLFTETRLYKNSYSKFCEPINQLKRGSIICDCPVNQATFGCNCRFSCNEGFYLSGNPMVHCTNFGNWSSSNPICKRGRSCPLSFNLHSNVILLYCNTSINGKCFYRCKGNLFFIDSSGSIKTNKLKNWSSNENFSDPNKKTKKINDFTLKKNVCLSTGKWSNEFKCESDENLLTSSLTELNLYYDNLDSINNTQFLNHKRIKRRKQPKRRLRPMNLVRPLRIRRRRRRRRRRKRKPPVIINN